MFFPARMERVTVGVHRDYAESFIRAAQENALFEIIDIHEPASSISDLSSFQPQKEVLDQVIHLQLLLDRIIEILSGYQLESGQPYFKANKTLGEEMPALLGCDTDIIRSVEEIVRGAEKVLLLQEEFVAIREEITDVESSLVSLQKISSFGFNLQKLGNSKYCEYAAWNIPSSKLEEVVATFKDLESGEFAFFVQKNETWSLIITIVTLHEAETFHTVVRNLRLHALPLRRNTGYPDELFIEETKERESLYLRMREIEKELKAYCLESILTLQAAQEEMVILRSRLETSRKTGCTNRMQVIEGWFKVRDIEYLNLLAKKMTDDHVFIKRAEPLLDDDIPVEYDNPNWLKPFEFLTTMFARPRYDEIDPTPFVAPVFLLFFGLMLGDAGYGVVITLAALFLYRRAGKTDRTLKDMSIVLFGCGVVDIICGTLQGGWFGDLLPRFFGIDPPFVIIEPLETPIAFFILALVIGTVHINLGICLALWQNIRKKNWRFAFQEQVIWFIIQPAAAILLTSFFGWYKVPPGIMLLGWTLMLVGLVVIFWSRGPMGFFSLTGFLGDWLSYVRILALALATGGIAMTINILAGMVASIHPLMIIPAVFIFIAGQTFNLAIQSLGGVIHSIRLHYIEFFSKFYSGGGRAFRPLKAERIVTVKIQEEW